MDGPVTGAPLRTHCKREHPLTPDNIYSPPGKPQRMCLTCHRARGHHGRKTHAQQVEALRAVIADQADRIAALEAAIAALHPDRRRADGGVGRLRHRRVIAQLRRVA